MFYEAKICSGSAPAGSAAKFGGPVLSGASSVLVCGSGLRIKAWEAGALTLGDPPRPELVLLAVGCPPLILTFMSFFPLPLPVADPPLLVGPPPLAPGAPFGEPLGTPGCLPSGEMETCAARFPGGGVMGAGGPGAVESAMRVETFPFVTPDWAELTSGAGSTSLASARGARRGAAPAFSSNFGRAGAFGNMDGAISASFWSSEGRSGAGAVVRFTLRTSRGRSLDKVSWLICKRGRAGPAVCWSSTILGRFGRIFGGTRGAAELIRVCRGWFGWTGSVKMRWRGWKASPPSGGRGLSGSPRGIGLGAFAVTKGKSVMGPDQVSSVFSKAE